MKKLTILLAAAFAAIAMTACGPEQGEPVVTKDGAVTGVPDVVTPTDSTEPPAPADSASEPAVPTDTTSEEPSATVTEPTEPPVTTTPEPTTTEPTTASEKKTEKTTVTEATTTKATDPPATTPAPDEDDVEELVDEVINVDEYWAMLGIDDDDLSTDVEP